MVFRSARENDFEQSFELGRIAFAQYERHLDEEDWKKFNNGLNDKIRIYNTFKRAEVIVAEAREKVVGIVYIVPSGNKTEHFDNSWAYVRMLAVHPEYRNQGIAKQLMQLGIQCATSNGEKILALHTGSFMKEARGMYPKMGFDKIKNYMLFGRTYTIYLKQLLQKT